jgi:hypothetical protein
LVTAEPARKGKSVAAATINSGLHRSLKGMKTGAEAGVVESFDLFLHALIATNVLITYFHFDFFLGVNTFSRHER